MRDRVCHHSLCTARGQVVWPVAALLCRGAGGVVLFFMDCESGSGASLDAQDISGGFGLWHLCDVGGFGAGAGGSWLCWHGCLTQSLPLLTVGLSAGVAAVFRGV